MSSVKRRIFARHSNPLSAWSRWATIPLVVVPFWTRNRKHAAAVAAWMLANPVIFPEPSSHRAWSTRAMLGEEAWSSRMRLDGATAVSAATTAAMAVGIIGGWRKSAKLAVPAVAAQMALTLAFWQLMIKHYDGSETTRPGNDEAHGRETPDTIIEGAVDDHTRDDANPASHAD